MRIQKLIHVIINLNTQYPRLLFLPIESKSEIYIEKNYLDKTKIIFSTINKIKKDDPFW